MAIRELEYAATAETKSGRRDHIYNAASWTERADLLQRMDHSFEKRDAIEHFADRKSDGALPGGTGLVHKS